MALGHLQPRGKLFLGQVPVFAPLRNEGSTEPGPFRVLLGLSRHPEHYKPKAGRLLFRPGDKSLAVIITIGYKGGMARPVKDHPLFHWRMANGRRSLQSLADEIGCTQSHLSEIENWNNEPSLELAARLFRVTSIPIESFVKQGEAAQ